MTLRVSCLLFSLCASALFATAQNKPEATPRRPASFFCGPPPRAIPPPSRDITRLLLVPRLEKKWELRKYVLQNSTESFLRNIALRREFWGKRLGGFDLDLATYHSRSQSAVPRPLFFPGYRLPGSIPYSGFQFRLKF